MATLVVENRGPLIESTNFWDLGIPHVLITLNAGAYRVLLPQGLEKVVSEVRDARVALVMRGRIGNSDVMQVAFDDGSEAPFVLQTDIAAFVGGIPDLGEVGLDRTMTIWIRGSDGRPVLSTELPCRYLGTGVLEMP
jgi:hypothetical protein